MSRKTLTLLAVAILLIPLLLLAQQATERIDLNAIHKIKVAE
ncbi:exported hypothetical protein [Candidatus Sulfopaludibacter sp. SbA3]|nr:exported hypothetical protein [Candidatus Sulfopaludibacter sp. SbA3]